MLKHSILRNTEVHTALGTITFDNNGESNDLSQSDQEKLGELFNFNYVSDNADEEVKEVEDSNTEDTKEDTKEDNKEEDNTEDTDTDQVEEEEGTEYIYDDMTVEDIKEELDKKNYGYKSGLKKKEYFDILTGQS